jgi:hypothetical protein
VGVDPDHPVLLAKRTTGVGAMLLLVQGVITHLGWHAAACLPWLLVSLSLRHDDFGEAGYAYSYSSVSELTSSRVSAFVLS